MRIYFIASMAARTAILAVAIVAPASLAAPASPPARIEPCTIANGDVKECSGLTSGEVVSIDPSDAGPQEKTAMLHRCQCVRGLVRKCRSDPFNGWKVHQSVVDGKYRECKVVNGVLGDCKKQLYSGQADLVVCVSSQCAPPFAPSAGK
jgi:hypothetical protein